MSTITSGVIAASYCEFTCLRDAEISTGFLMGRLMHALHITMVNATADGQPCPLGVTFPDYQPLAASRRGRISGGDLDHGRVDHGRVDHGQVDHDQVDHDDIERLPPIGKRVRLFARSASELESISWARSFVGLDDYVHRTRPRSTPPTIESYAAFARYQPKASPERLIRRAMKRHGITHEEAAARYQGYAIDRCQLPWIDMRSEGSNHRFRLFIERRPISVTDQWGFSTYGLSRCTALPLF